MAADPSRPPPFFVGDHQSLDFLNSTAKPAGVRTEWLRDGEDLLGWLVKAQMLTPDMAERFRNHVALNAVAARARVFREWLRAFVVKHVGAPLSVQAMSELGPLNQLLAEDDSYSEVGAAVDRNAMELQRVPRWSEPGQLLQPLARAAADLICHADFRLIRSCEGSECVLLFLDRTKAHGRRWCSMAACGNRAKAAAHRARARRNGGESSGGSLAD